MPVSLLRSPLAFLLLSSILLLMGCSAAPVPDEAPVSSGLSALLTPLTPDMTPDDVAACELQCYGSAGCTRETYANGNLACTYGGVRKYVFSGTTLHSINFYGTENFPADIDAITAAIGAPTHVSGDSYILWNADFSGVPVTVVFTANPVDPARTRLTIEFPH